jgi:putative CocE/NonD family hydrolase
MSLSMTMERNVLVPMRDGVPLAVDVLRPPGPQPVPAILNFGPYHKDGRGGRLSVDSVHRHFAALGYACVSADLRGLGNSAGCSPGAFAPGEAQDGHDLVEWIASQPWCDGQVGMWGVSYPGITALSTAATNPPHLRAVIPIHASADLHRGVASLGGTGSGFWMRADWGPRMAAYNLMPPLWQDGAGRWAKVWAEHLEGNVPWLEAFSTHPGFDDFWRSRVVDITRITCPTFQIGGWRDLYADCTPRDFCAITAPKKLLMGAWKHEFPDTGREAPAAGLWEMQRWFERWLKGVHNGIDEEPAVSLYVQGRAGFWRAEPDWPPVRVTSRAAYLLPDGSLGNAPAEAGPSSSYRYDPTVGMYSLAWDPWTTALDPALPRDHSADDARSLCFTGPPLQEPMELVGVPEAVLDLCASALPLHVVVKLSAVAPNGSSTLITTGWLHLGDAVESPTRREVRIALRATAYQLQPGERLRVALSCADFPRVWPTPIAAELQLFHGSTRVLLPVCPTPAAGHVNTPEWGPLQSAVLGSPNDLGGAQTWDIQRDLMTDAVRLAATRTERVRVDGQTELQIDHAYGAAVAAARPDLARMQSTTTVRLNQGAGMTELSCRTLATSHQASVDVAIHVDGQPFWQRHWQFEGPAQ